MKLDKIAKRMIVIEGIDGSGKSSVVNELIKYIRTDENITRIIEPSHNVIGSLIREMIIGDDMSHEVLPEDCVKISTNGKTIKEVVGECYVIIMKYILSVHRVEPSSEEYQL